MEWWMVIVAILAFFGAGWITVMVVTWIFLANLYKVDRKDKPPFRVE